MDPVYQMCEIWSLDLLKEVYTQVAAEGTGTGRGGVGGANSLVAGCASSKVGDELAMRA